jgi:hypothetical protein
MKHLRPYLRRLLVPVGLGISLALTGCGRQGEAPKEVPLAQVPQTIESAFQKAGPEARKQSGEVLEALKGKDLPKALLGLQALSARSDTTALQREIAAHCMVTVNQEVQAAATNGDNQAAEVIQYRRSTK